MKTRFRPFWLMPTMGIFLILPDYLAAQAPPKPEDFITRQAGKLPIILSAPHDGKLAIPGVTVRQGEGVAKFVTVRDTNAGLVAEKLAEAIEKQMGAKPYFVIAKFSRKYVDANRPVEGAYEDPDAKPIYDAYHDALRKACQEVKKEYGQGIVIDLHGQAASAETVFRGTVNLKSVDLLKTRYGLKAITGSKSILGVLAEKGHVVFPPLDKPMDKEHRSYSGGYITQTYGAMGNFGLDAIQLELGWKQRNPKYVEAFAQDLATAIHTFAGEYLNWKQKK